MLEISSWKYLAVLFCAVQLSEVLPTGESLWEDNSVIKSRLWCVLALKNACSCFTVKGRILFTNKFNSFQITVNFFVGCFVCLYLRFHKGSFLPNGQQPDTK